MPSFRDYYATLDRFTEPGDYAAQVATLPDDLANLHACINGLIIHVWKIRKYHPQLLDLHSHDVFTRHTRHLLAHIAARGADDWLTERPVERRLIVDCRQFALLLCAVLRERGIPARARCGFATYLEPTHAQDHWICEYWNDQQQRWVMEDPDLQKHDVPPDQFITGARAWQHCRADPSVADRFGFGAAADERGLWTVRLDTVLDIAAINGFVGVSGDTWGIAEKDESAITDVDQQVLDQAAQFAISNDSFEQLHQFYETQNGLRPSAEIRHFDYIAGGNKTVDWAQQL